MKDIVITGRTLRRELFILLGCFVAAVIFDIVAIVKYSKPFVEVFQTIGYEITIALGLYAFLAIIRLIVWLFLKILRH